MKTAAQYAIDQGQGYTWGPIIQVHQIGPYVILEYTPRVTGSARYEGVSFHAFVDGGDTNHSFNTLDAALAGAMAYRAEGPNSRAGQYFMNMIHGKV